MDLEVVVGRIQKVGHLGKDEGRAVAWIALVGKGATLPRVQGNWASEVGLFAMPQVQEEDRVGDGVDVEIVLEENVRQGQNHAQDQEDPLNLLSKNGCSTTELDLSHCASIIKSSKKY